MAGATEPTSVGYTDPRIVALYDAANPDGPDHDFFRTRADELGVRRIVDLGCGTGILTVTLAAPGRTVVGIDPAAAMLDVAARRDGGDAIEWRLGTSELIEPDSTDLVIMSGNVAMHILRGAWPRTLSHIAAGLRPGGRLLFETRNPEAEAWREWSGGPDERDTAAGRLRESESTSEPDADGVVTMRWRTEFLASGDVVDGADELQFRTADQVRADLAAAGLEVVSLWRDWYRTPFTGGADQRLIVVEAVRR